MRERGEGEEGVGGGRGGSGVRERCECAGVRRIVGAAGPSLPSASPSPVARRDHHHDARVCKSVNRLDQGGTGRVREGQGGWGRSRCV